MYLSQNDQNDNQRILSNARAGRRELTATGVAVNEPHIGLDRKPKLLTPADERSLVWRWQRRKDYRARDALVRAFQPAIVGLARKYQARGLDLDDLISLGNIGFLVALDKFNIKLRWKLWTYAKHWVRAEISAATEKSRSIVARPRQRGEAKKHLPDFSLNIPVPGGDGAEYVDFLLDDYLDHEPYHFNNEELTAALELLTPRQRAIFTARRLSDEPEKRSTLAIQFQISSERVRQIESDALAIVSARMKGVESRPSPQFARQMTATVFSGRGHKVSYSWHQWPDFRDRSPESNRERLR